MDSKFKSMKKNITILASRLRLPKATPSAVGRSLSVCWCVILINLLAPLIFFYLMGGNICYSQDIHFSQFYNTPLLLNPGLTGASNADLRAIVNYKDQWRIIGSPYKTFAFSYDMALLKEKFKNSFLGAGICAFNDKAGDTELGLTQIALSVASIVH